MWHFLKLVVRGFPWVLQFPPLLHQLMVSAYKIKLKWMQFQLCQTSKLSSPFVPSDTWHVSCDVLHMICPRLRPGHLSVHVGDSSWHSEEIAKKSWIEPFNAIIIIITIIITINLPFPLIPTKTSGLYDATNSEHLHLPLQQCRIHTWWCYSKYPSSLPRCSCDGKTLWLESAVHSCWVRPTGSVPLEWAGRGSCWPATADCILRRVHPALLKWIAP